VGSVDKQGTANYRTIFRSVLSGQPHRRTYIEDEFNSSSITFARLARERVPHRAIRGSKQARLHYAETLLRVFPETVREALKRLDRPRHQRCILHYRSHEDEGTSS